MKFLDFISKYPYLDTRALSKLWIVDLQESKKPFWFLKFEKPPKSLKKTHFE